MSISKKIASNQQLFDQVADIAAVFGSAARLKILQLLAQAPRPVDAISRTTGESVANTSQHLQKLLSEGLVQVKKEKLSRIYRLSDERVALMIESLFDLAEHLLPELAESARVDAIDFGEALQELDLGKAVMLDLREDYETGHTPVEGAVSIPLATLKDAAQKFRKNKTYYLVCRGRACDLATEGVRILRSKGFKAYRLKESPAAIRQRARRASHGQKEKEYESS